MAGLQLRYETGLTGEEYVKAEAWRDARLERCPIHPHGGCSIRGHGTYERKTPRGAKVPRWYCRESHTTDQPSGRLSGGASAGHAGRCGSGCRGGRGGAEPGGCGGRAAHGRVELPGAVRWVRRRVRLIHDVLSRIIGLIPDRLAGCAATMVAVRARLGSDRALMTLRALVAAQLAMLPSPLGFQAHGIGVTGRNPASQHSMGP